MLGDDLHAEVRRAEMAIADQVATWPRWPGIAYEVRRFTSSRFPYSLAFQVVWDNVAIIAVAHQRREPFYWRHRAGK